MMSSNLFQASLKKLFLLFIILYSFQANAHKFYVSLTDINYNAQNQTLEVTIKVFTDDFEDCLNSIHGTSNFLCTEKEIPEIDIQIEKYLTTHFKIENSATPLSSNYIGKKCENDYCYLFLEFSKFNLNEEYQLHNSILIDDFEEQVNKVNFKVNDQIRSYTLNKNKQSVVL